MSVVKNPPLSKQVIDRFTSRLTRIREHQVKQFDTATEQPSVLIPAPKLQRLIKGRKYTIDADRVYAALISAFKGVCGDVDPTSRGWKLDIFSAVKFDGFEVNPARNNDQDAVSDKLNGELHELVTTYLDALIFNQPDAGDLVEEFEKKANDLRIAATKAFQQS